ncbi:T9SS type A sorting domain-containing protein [Algoriphagus chordae]|uniref:Putative secreted protein (Por secretion system target) n=1 Tax=Algoriphagus chordae TaxID=237019 RepID=A0A2W7QXA8_9BACT|nr:T9SS type A sorting domain-containing protein [Algoriphagus chordae]PZX48297.1 putative secreted protein (Por secretion system target) [Algoriphagus chordae]
MKKQLLFILGLLVFMVLASHRPTEVNPFRVYPYLQAYGEGKMQLTWFSNSLATSSIKLLSATGSVMYEGAVTAESVPEIYYTSAEKNQQIDGLEQGSWIQSEQAFRFRFPIDLPADVQVNYIVTLAGLNYSGTFTMPSSKSSWEKIRFIALADSETDPRGRVTNRAWYPGTPLFRPITTVPELWKQKFGSTIEQGIELPNYMLTEEKGYNENLRIINARNPNFIIMPGDLVQGAGYQPAWDEFFRQNAGELGTGLSRYAIIPALGNWEAFGAVNGGYGTNEKGEFLPVLGRKRFHTYFETPTEDPLQKHRQSYYRVDYGPVTILTLDSSNGTPDQTEADFDGQPKLSGKEFTLPGTDTQENYTDSQYKAAGGNDLSSFGPGSDQYIWLEDNLKDASEAGQLIFVQYHHIAFSSGEHGVPLNHELSIGQVGTPMRVLNPMLEEYGVIAVFSGHDELFERSFVDEDSDGKGIMYYDVGVAGDGMRGEKRDWLGNPLNTLDYNPYRMWSADQSSAEEWDTSGANPVLTDGGKHYGHLEVNLEKTKEGNQEFALVNFTPVYVFPVMDQNYNLQQVERRVYKDEVSLKIPLRVAAFEPEVKDSVAIYLNHEGEGYLTALDFLEDMPEGNYFVFSTDPGPEFGCDDIGLNEVKITSKNTSTGQEWMDQTRLYVLDTIAPTFTYANAYEAFDLVSGSITIGGPDFAIWDPLDNCSTSFDLIIEKNNITCEDIDEESGYAEVPVKITLKDNSGNSTVEKAKVFLNIIESKTVSLENTEEFYEGQTVKIELGEELGYEVLAWYRNGELLADLQGKSIEIDKVGNYYAKIRLSSGCITRSQTLEISLNPNPYPPVKERIELVLNESGQAELLLEDVFQSWPLENEDLILSLSKSEFTCEDLGAQEVIVIIQDGSGNDWEEKIEVVVLDEMAPILETKNLELELDLTLGALQLKTEDFIESVTDNCEIKEVTISRTQITCEDLGKEIGVEIRAVDIAGNVTEKTAQVMVKSLSTKPVSISGPELVCIGDTQILTLASEADFEVVRWRRNGTEISGATGKTLEIEEGGSYHAIVRYAGACLFETEKFEVVSAAFPSGEIVEDGNILRAPEGDFTYQWYKNGEKIDGAISRSLEVQSMGEYSVELKNTAGCETRLAAVTMTISGIFNPGILVSEELKIYPNPASAEVEIQALGDLKFAENSMRIYNSSGREVSSSVEVIRQSSSSVSLAIARLSAGTYVIMVESRDNRVFVGKLIKQ